MPTADESDPISDDEILYRRAPVSKDWVDEHGVSAEAFAPLKGDLSGLSVFRARFLPLEEAARGASKQGYYVLELRAGDLRGAGIDIVPAPIADKAGHAEIPALKYERPESNASLEIRQLLADRLVRKTHGPFVGP
jgi:hypothetical protein